MASGRLVLGAADPALNALGQPAVGATLTIYETGTTTLAALFGDPALEDSIVNPQTANAAGRFYQQATTIWADATLGYDVVLAYPDGTSTTYTDISMLAQSTGSGGAFMPIAGGTFTGPVSGLSPADNDDSQLLPTTSWVDNALEPFAPLESPALTGEPTTPDPTTALGIANKEYVDAAVAGGATDDFFFGTITGGALTTGHSTGFSSIVRSSAGAFNFTFTTPKADTNYSIFTGISNNTTLQGVTPLGSKTVNGFAVQVLTTSSNVPTDPAGLSVLVKGS